MFLDYLLFQCLYGLFFFWGECIPLLDGRFGLVEGGWHDFYVFRLVFLIFCFGLSHFVVSLYLILPQLYLWWVQLYLAISVKDDKEQDNPEYRKNSKFCHIFLGFDDFASVCALVFIEMSSLFLKRVIWHSSHSIILIINLTHMKGLDSDDDFGE